MSLPATVQCNEDCDFDIPAVKFADCNPEVNESQVSDLYLSQTDADDFNDWTQATEWGDRISPDATDKNSIRNLKVVGDKPKPETQSRTISGKRVVVTGKNHVLNFDIDETNAINHEFVRGSKCIKQVKMHYGTIGGLLFGGNTGIKATMEVDMTLSRTDGDIVLYQGTLKWSSLDTEERCPSPLF